MRIPQPFPYQGSKRKIAHEIVALLPNHPARLIEPFVGSGAVSLRAAASGKAEQFVFNDINAPLIALWERIVNAPDEIADQYAALWHRQLGQEKAFYFQVRDHFNQTYRPDYLLYLLARCVKAAVRYNANGEFNQSADNRRKGMQPDRMRQNIRHTARLLKNRVSFYAVDYREILAQTHPTDVVYMDPPYQGVNQQDPRYVQRLALEELSAALQDLNARNVPFMVSYDGRTGKKVHGQLLPESLNLTRIEINAGRSSQATLLGRSSTTFESLYLSANLSAHLKNRLQPVLQLSLWT
ncbi:MAG: DNA adenine methylase [Anaerolineae bacterium]|nr:DNA adenine methylase [Anaerolineae bacterium]